MPGARVRLRNRFEGRTAKVAGTITRSLVPRYDVWVPYVEVPASGRLRSLVACYWAFSGPRSSHRVLPDGCIDILLAGSRASVVGTMTHALVTPPSTRGVIGIRFRPGEAARLLPDAPRALTDREAPLADFWHLETGAIEDALASVFHSRSTERLAGETLEATLGRVALRIDGVLERQLTRGAGPVDLQMRTATRLLEMGTSVRETAKAVGLSERQLARRFEARVGVGPKTFGRVMRLQHATSAIASGLSAAAAASLAGYADQAHFTRDARDLAATTPRTLAIEAAEP